MRKVASLLARPLRLEKDLTMYRRDYLGWIEDRLISVMTFVYLSIAVIEVFRRYVLGDSSAWAPEVIRYLFIATVYLGCSSAVKHNAHIKVDILFRLVRVRLQLVFLILSQVPFLVFALFITVLGYSYALGLYGTGQLSSGLQMPLAIAYFVIPIGFLLTTIRLIEVIVRLSQLLRLEENEIRNSLNRYEVEGL